jgi:deoxyribodipyrimidine photo-lyase
MDAHMVAMAMAHSRIRCLNQRVPNAAGKHVVYWMTAFRRPFFNAALQHAAEVARAHHVPLLVLEPLRLGYRWASTRLHRFVLDGMADNARAFAQRRVAYHPYVEPQAGAGAGLLEALATDAVCVVGDDYPCFFLPRMHEAAAKRLRVPLELVDANGLWPMRATDRVFLRAHDFRRHLQRELRPHLAEPPLEDPLATELIPGVIPPAIAKRWPAASPALLAGTAQTLAVLDIDHSVAPAATQGGYRAATAQLRRFVDECLPHYLERNHPDVDAASSLSPWLHFGHLSAHQVFEHVAGRESWSLEQLGEQRRGGREGYWGMSAAAEAFLDQLVTWRELGFNMCAQRDDYDRLESLPAWARQTLFEHADDPRPVSYDRVQFENAATHDEVWNAAQRQLVREGRMHNYLRMFWGKKLLHWSPSPADALEVMIELNNKYALDGRDPNSYSGIFWVLGRYDRAWGPEREVFGKIRFMSSASTRRKLRLKAYLERYRE